MPLRVFPFGAGKNSVFFYCIVQKRFGAQVPGIILGIFIISLCAGFRMGSVLAADLTMAETVRDRVQEDIAEASTFTCGGMMYNDNRLNDFYHSTQQPLECQLAFTCNKYDPVTGKCIGQKCEIAYEDGIPERSLLYECDAAGTCTPPIPHQSCSFSQASSTYRVWKCTKGSLEEAHCYSYLPNYRYEQSYSPLTFNCIGNYRSTPVRAEEPKGALSLEPALDTLADPRRTAPGWNAVEGSAVATLKSGEKSPLADSTLPGLMLDMVTMEPQYHTDPQIYTSPFWQQDYPDLDRMMNDLLRPPEIRLILPYGSAVFPQTGSSWMKSIFPFIKNDAPQQSMVVSTLRETPDILHRAAEFLRSTPMVEVRYVPVTVQVPTGAPLELHALASDWEVWLNNLIKRVGDHSDASLPPGLEDRVKENIEAIRSAIALQDSIREYRLLFPQYLDALLTYVEKTNAFHTSWMTLNADRLEAWHTAYASYLPQLRTRIKEVRDLSAAFTQQCLVPACRLDVLPIKETTKPWDIFPDVSSDPTADPLSAPELTLSGSGSPWLPGGAPLWEDAGNDLARGELTRWHMPATVGLQLPDLTFDFSMMARSQLIEIPVVRLESLPLTVPPPPFDPVSYPGNRLQSRLDLVMQDLSVLPHFAPPSIDLTFPSIEVPDPQSSLLLVPPEPEVLPLWERALDWRKKRLAILQSQCDTSRSPKTFLLSEHMLLAGHPLTINRLNGVEVSLYDPARLRAYGFSGVVPASGLFSHLSLSIPLTDYWSSYWWDWFGWRRCETCMQERPQRTFIQNLQMEVQWENLQENIIRMTDVWNAQVQYYTIVSRNEAAERDSQPWEEDQPLLDPSASATP